MNPMLVGMCTLYREVLFVSESSRGRHIHSKKYSVLTFKVHVFYLPITFPSIWIICWNFYSNTESHNYITTLYIVVFKVFCITSLWSVTTNYRTSVSKPNGPQLILPHEVRVGLWQEMFCYEQLLKLNHLNEQNDKCQ